MTTMDLNAKFKSSDIEWRIVLRSNVTTLAKPFIKKSALFERLDQCFSKDWNISYEEIYSNSVLSVVKCTISVLNAGQVVAKTGVGTIPSLEANVDPGSKTKAAHLDALSDCASAWGIGRYLEDHPFMRVTGVNESTAPVGESEFKLEFDFLTAEEQVLKTTAVEKPEQVPAQSSVSSQKPTVVEQTETTEVVATKAAIVEKPEQKEPTVITVAKQIASASAATDAATIADSTAEKQVESTELGQLDSTTAANLFGTLSTKEQQFINNLLGKLKTNTVDTIMEYIKGDGAKRLSADGKVYTTYMLRSYKPE